MGKRKPTYHPSTYTDSTIVPTTLHGLLGEISRIASDYDLREHIISDGGWDSTYDSLLWRDCIDLANAISRGAARQAA